MRDGQPGVGREAVPKEIRWAILILGILILVHLIVVPVMWVQRIEIARSISASNPNLSPDEIVFVQNATLIASIVFHLVFAALYAWMAFKIHAGRWWARNVLTVALIIGALASAVSFSLSSMFRALIPISDLLQIAVIALLWVPRPSRAYFAAARCRNA